MFFQLPQGIPEQIYFTGDVKKSFARVKTKTVPKSLNKAKAKEKLKKTNFPNKNHPIARYYVNTFVYFSALCGCHNQMENDIDNFYNI